jgi:tetratricopeptide (TPR) repeat protein
MIRLLLAVVLVVVGSLPLRSLAHETGEQVVARITLKAPDNKEQPIFAEQGDLMTVIDIKDKALLVKTSLNRRGWIRAADVVALPQAAPVYDDLIRQKPKDPWHYVSRAMVWNLRGEKEREIADLDRAIALGVKGATVWVNRGVAHATSGDYDKAITDYNQAIERGFTDPTVYMNRAVAYMSKKEPQKAIDDFSRVVEAQPDSVFALMQRGIAYQQLQQYEKAVGDFTAVLKVDAENPQAINNRGFTYYLMNDPKKAVADFTAAIELNPQSALAYNNRGFNRQMFGDYAGAIADFNKAIEFSPKYALAYQNKAWLLATCPEEKIRDGKAAIAAAQKAGELREWKAITDIKSLAAAYAETGDFDKAVEWQKKAIDLAEGEGKSGEEELLKLYQAKAPFRFAPPAEGSATP